MKKIFKRVSAAVMALAVAATAVVFDVPKRITEAASTTSGNCGSEGDNVTWSLSDGVLTISGEGAMKDFTYDMNMAQNSFTVDTPWAIEDVTEIVVEEGVTHIGNCAFLYDQLGDLGASECVITLPNSVTSIGDYAFFSNALPTMPLPSKLQTIGDFAFCFTFPLDDSTEFTIPPSVTQIGELGFFPLPMEGKISYYEGTELTKCDPPNYNSSVADATDLADFVYLFLGMMERITFTDDDDTFTACETLGMEIDGSLPKPISGTHSHGICGVSGCTDSSHPAGHNTEITDWTAISSASGFNNLQTGKHYYLTQSFQLNDEVTIGENTDITLCLNGQTLTAASGKRIFSIDGGSLTLCDCQSSGKLTGGNSADNGGGVYVGSSGTFTMYGGIITNNSSSKFGGGVHVDSKNDNVGTFIMYGGEISGNTASENGGGVYVDGIFTMNGGTISNNTTSNDDGGGVSIDTSGEFIINGGTISGNIAQNGGGVNLWGGKFTMNGGTISDNKASNGGGGGVYFYTSSSNPPFTMNGGTISGNTASGNGGGVCGFNYDPTDFIMNGGTISDNKAGGNGGGVRYFKKMTLNGKVTVTGNKSGADNAQKDDNVYLPTNKTLTIGSSFSTDSRIGITTYVAPTCQTSVDITTADNVSTATVGSFKADKEGLEIAFTDSKLQLKGSHTFDATTGVCTACGNAGKCGDNAAWAYDDTTKTLTISGTGTMTDWTSSSDVPWNDKAADIKNVVIEEGITSIGKYAFKGCSSLTSVTIPDGVDSIGSWAFDGCTELASITIPSSVTSIKTYAFQNCSKLTSITIPRGSRLANIGLRAFYNCSCLTAIDIPGSVTSIDQEAFSGCTSLRSITIPNGVTSISANTFNGCSSLSSITIPNSVTYIGTNAFYNCSRLTAITIPNNVTSIDDRAFSGCSSLSSITIPGKVATIGQSAFSNCTGLSSITIPNSVNRIYATAFSGCTNLETVTFENATPPATIGTNLFNGCTNLEKIFVPAGSAETYKGLERLDPYKDKIFEVAAENSCGTNATWAYDEATKTLTISGTGAMTDWEIINSMPWADKQADIEKIVIEDGITSIGKASFTGCTNLASVTIPDTVTTIGEVAFSGCSKLKPITIPNSVNSIGDTAFQNCTSLETITIPSSVNSIGVNAFKGCSNLASIEIAEGITSIGNYAFSGCSGLTSITIPNSVNSIGEQAFSSCSELASITIPDSVTSIGEEAFMNCSKLTSITIPDEVTSIGNYTFYGCTKLETVTFKGENPPTIDDTAFNGCNALDKIAVPEGKADAYKNALTGLAGLPDKVTDSTTDNKCGDNATWALDEATKTLTISGTGDMTDWTLLGSDVPWADKAADIEKVVINSGVTSVGDLAFRGCTGLTSVTIPDGVTSIGTNAFEGCSGLTSVNIPNTVTSIEDGAFSGCTGLTSIKIPDGVTSIGICGFQNCSSLTSVTIPDSVTSIGDGAFRNCTSLTSITIPKNVTSIGGEAFDGCTDLETVTFKGATPPATMGNEVFKDCAALDKIVVPEGKADAYKTAIADLSEKITADTSGDNTSGGNTSGDNTSGDNTSGGNTSGGNTSGDNTSGDNTSGDNTSGGNTSGGNTSGGNINTENTSKDVQLGENVPKTEFATPIEELISAVLAPEELAQLKDTDKVSVVLEIVENVPAEDKQSVGSYLESGSHVLAQYMDVALYKIINDNKTRITSTNKPIRITFEVPEGLRAADRTFAVLRVHDGETVLLPDLDNDENTVTIETDKFSTYALVYRDNASAPGSDNPSTGIAVSLIPLVTAAAILTVAVKLKKK